MYSPCMAAVRAIRSGVCDALIPLHVSHLSQGPVTTRSKSLIVSNGAEALFTPEIIRLGTV